MQKITPFLWFDHQAEEAAKFYTSVFKNSRLAEFCATMRRQQRAPGDRRDLC